MKFSIKLLIIFTSIIITISSILTYFQMDGTNEYLDRTIKDTISETLDSLEDKINLSIESKVDVSKSVVSIYENLLEGNPLSVNLRMLMSIIFPKFFNCSDMLMKERERSLLMTQTLKCLRDSIQELDPGI